MKLVRLLAAVALLGLSAHSSAQTWQAVGGVPVGAVMFFATSSCPPGWLEANGSSISQGAYPALYSATGGYTPDLRGQFVRGWDRSGSYDPGRGLGTYQQESGPTAATVSAGVGSVPVAGPLRAAEVRPRNIALLACIKG